jgi:alpha-beta hydrolase superfamily lysophospholipase
MDISIRLSNGQLLRGVINSPGEDIKGLIIFVHGLGEHIQRYSSWVEKFRTRNIGFVGFDLPGHGRSDGRRGNIKSYTLTREMLDKLIYENNKTFPGIPLFLYGYNIGGGIVIEYILKRKPDIAGAILSSPFLKLSVKSPKIKHISDRFLSWLYPSFTQKSEIDITHFSHDPGFVEKYKNDPLMQNDISVSLYNSALEAGAYSLQNADKLKVPVLVMHGSDDTVTSPEASREFVSKTSMAELKIWEGGYHELHNETFKEDVFTYVSDWIEKHI